jgi:urease accessory protein
MESLLIFGERIRAEEPIESGVAGSLVLPFELRQKARQRARLESGRAIGIQLARGTVLRDGDLLRAATGEIVEIIAATELVSNAYSDDLVLLARASYHLGNRHVHLQVGPGWVRYLRDHVLDHMVESLGLTVMHVEQAFEPEAGAYRHERGRGHGNGHDSGHGHGH